MVKESEERIEMINENFKTTIGKGTISIEPVEKKNSTLEDLKQNLINKLNEQVDSGNPFGYDEKIELLKIILEYENHKPTDWQNSVYASKVDLQSSKFNIDKNGTINCEKN